MEVKRGEGFRCGKSVAAANSVTQANYNGYPKMLNVGLMRVTCVLGLIALGGCQGAKPKASLPSSPAVDNSLSSDSLSQEGQEEQRPKKKKMAAIAPADRQPAAPDSTKKQDAEMPDPDIGVVGLDESGIRALFGEPISEIDDAPAKRLNYRTGTCSIEFALYPDVDTRTYRTLTLEVRNDDGTAKGQRICVADLKSRIEDRRQEAR